MALELRVDIPIATRAKIKRLSPKQLNIAITKTRNRFSALMKRFLTAESFKKTKARTGTYARSWGAVPRGDSIVFFNSAKSKNGFRYPNVLEFGSGIYRPGGTRIKPKKSGGVLAWKAKSPASLKHASADGWVYAKSIKGIKPKRVFMTVFRQQIRNYPKILLKEVRHAFFGI